MAEVKIDNLVIAGWTGRDELALRKHIKELEEIGVKPPKTTPIFYRVSADLLTQDTKIQASGPDTSGEVEFVLVQKPDGMWVHVGSDHTDRKAETVGVSLSKQLCRKPISVDGWRYDEVKPHSGRRRCSAWSSRTRCARRSSRTNTASRCCRSRGDDAVKVLAKDVYSLLRSAFFRDLKGAGFRKLEKVTLGWTRPSGERHLSFWVQLDRHGWFDDVGSSFTIEFQLSAKILSGAGGFAERERFAQLLDARERETVREINNRILSGLRPLSPNHPALLLNEEMRGWFLSKYKPEPEPYPENRDVWLHYAAIDHVAEWARFFQPRLVRLAAAFEARRA
jgi:hypothetical protein